jgi:hypothetical protein
LCSSPTATTTTSGFPLSQGKPNDFTLYRPCSYHSHLPSPAPLSSRLPFHQQHAHTHAPYKGTLLLTHVPPASLPPPQHPPCAGSTWHQAPPGLPSALLAGTARLGLLRLSPAPPAASALCRRATRRCARAGRGAPRGQTGRSCVRRPSTALHRGPHRRRCAQRGTTAQTWACARRRSARSARGCRAPARCCSKSSSSRLTFLSPACRRCFDLFCTLVLTAALFNLGGF